MGLRDWFQKKDQLSQLSDELQELVAERDELSRKCQQLEQQCEKVSASLTLEQYRRQDVLEQVDCLSHLFQRFCTQPPTPEQLYNQAAPYLDPDGFCIYAAVTNITGICIHDYEIDVATGEVVKSDYEAKVVVGTSNSATISEADAKKTVLARVSGATASDIYEWELDYDDGRPEYEGKIIYGGSEYEFTIDATSGTIIEWDVEVIHK